MPRELHQAVAFLLGLAIAFWLSPLRIEASSPDLPDPQLAPLETDLLQQVNAARVQHHLLPMLRTPDLDAVARAHSRDMAARGYVAHESPEGANAVDRLSAARLSGFSLVAPNREIELNDLMRGAERSLHVAVLLFDDRRLSAVLGVERARLRGGIEDHRQRFNVEFD